MTAVNLGGKGKQYMIHQNGMSIFFIFRTRLTVPDISRGLVLILLGRALFSPDLER
jgi:hypothetical protein